jgi:hypothetical protein
MPLKGKDYFIKRFHDCLNEMPAFEAYYEIVHEICETYPERWDLIGKYTKAIHDANDSLSVEER